MNAGAGVERAALAMLRTLGGCRASLLIPQPAAVSGQSGLGLSAPLASAVGLEPVLLRTTGLNANGGGRRLVAAVAPCTVQKALEEVQVLSGGESALRRTLESSRLRAGEIEYRIVSVTAKWMGGTKLLYELEIEE